MAAVSAVAWTDAINNAISLYQKSPLTPQINCKTDIAETQQVQFWNGEDLKQLAMIKKVKAEFGGSLIKGNPRMARPISTRKPMHLVLKSSRANGANSFLRRENSRAVESVLYKHAVLNGVKIERLSNAGNHLHLIVRITTARLFKKFLRVVTGLIARAVLKAQRAAGKLKAEQKFWDARPFTRIVEWGRAVDILHSYLVQNKLEALGFIKHQARDGKRKILTIRTDPEDVPKEMRL